MTASIPQPAHVALDLDEIQGGVLRQRPQPYNGAYYLVRIDVPEQGRVALAKLRQHVTSAAQWWDRSVTAWISIGISHPGLAALGVPDEVLSTFAPEFQAGMAARAPTIGDTGPSAPETGRRPSAVIRSTSRSPRSLGTRRHSRSSSLWPAPRSRTCLACRLSSS